MIHSVQNDLYVVSAPMPQSTPFGLIEGGFKVEEAALNSGSAALKDEELMQTLRPDRTGQISAGDSTNRAVSTKAHFDDTIFDSRQSSPTILELGGHVTTSARAQSLRAIAFRNIESQHTHRTIGKIVDEFVERWPIEFHFWDILAETVAAICTDEMIKKMKLKCHVNHRAKAQASLRKSIERRQATRGDVYRSREEIEKDMIDLAGVRITLAFPKDVEEVRKFVKDQFGEVEQRFWGLDDSRRVVEGHMTDRFPGYRATHFLIKWKEPKNHLFRTKLTEAHVGKTVEIQVTSIIMSAWAEAQHDLVYKQLGGAPSEDEKYLLVMINGLAHAGEVALTQLQNCLKRRIKDQSRDFADEYELRAWLKKHVPKMLKVEKWRDYGPYMQRLRTLFEVLHIFNLKTPEKVQMALEAPLDSRKMYPNIESEFIEDLMGRFQEKLLDRGKKWQEIFRNDPTDWATLKICAHRCAIPLSNGMPQIYEDRLKAFFIVNTINFALSEDLSRAKWIQDVVEKVLHPNSDYKGALIESLYTLLTKSSSGHRMSQDSKNIEMIWRGLNQIMIDVPTIFLRLGFALSYSGIVTIPAVTHPHFIDEEATRFVIWPGSWPYNAEKLWSGSVSIVPADEQLALGEFEWRKARISLSRVASGEGWFPEGPPVNTSFSSERLMCSPLEAISDVAPLKAS